VVIAAVGLAAAILVWAALNFTVEGFVMLVNDEVRVAKEVALSLAQLFGALVLSMYPPDDVGRRLHWMAAGFVVLGLDHLAFGYLEPALEGAPTSPNEALYEGLFINTIAGAFFVVALIPNTPPKFLWRVGALVFLTVCPTYVLVFETVEDMGLLPILTRVENAAAITELKDEASVTWLTWRHWLLYTVPLLLASAALVGAIRQNWRGALSGWLLFAVVLFAGAQLHLYLWPTIYGSPVLTTAELLSFAFATLIAIVGVIELRRIANERAALLAAERESIQFLTQLAALRADFASMVAHEFGNPLVALGRLTRILKIDDLGPETRSWAAEALEKEVNTLNTLVKDVQSAAVIQCDDFEVEIRPVPLDAILPDAEASSRTLPDEHRVDVVLDPTLKPHQKVMADPERIGQVLRNLLSNAAKYSPKGAPIELRVKHGQGRVRIEVADKGTGVHPEDVFLIFEKFGRGRDLESRKVAGVGLGLYLSRRIVQAHKSDLTVDSKPGEGSVFAFELEVAR
jgi:signal transduction histidine kinase